MRFNIILVIKKSLTKVNKLLLLFILLSSLRLFVIAHHARIMQNRVEHEITRAFLYNKYKRMQLKKKISFLHNLVCVFNVFFSFLINENYYYHLFSFFIYYYLGVLLLSFSIPYIIFPIAL
jgi:cell division protein FtsL